MDGPERLQPPHLNAIGFALFDAGGIQRLLGVFSGLAARCPLRLTIEKLCSAGGQRGGCLRYLKNDRRKKKLGASLFCQPLTAYCYMYPFTYMYICGSEEQLEGAFNAG